MDITRNPRLVHSVLAGLVFTGLASSQSLDLPPSHASISGSGSTNVPFGRSIPTRAQFVYDASLFGGQPWTFGTIEFRVQETMTAGAKGVDLEILASTSPNSVIATQHSFAANRGADETTVFSRKVLTLPAAGTGADPNPFDVTIPLDTPFTFDPSSGGSLVLEFVVYGQQPFAYTLDTAFVCDSPRGGYGPAGCGPVGGPTLKADSLTTQVTWGNALNLRVYDATPGATTAISFGYIESGTWNGIPIPFDLSVIGATGCSLSIDARYTFGQVADATGTGQLTMFLPSQPNLVGQWIRFQGFSLDPGANALGVTTSQAYKVQVCGWEPVARVYSNNTTSATGLREIGTAPVVRLR
ncbi:MAG: hypothetical protein KDB80_08385 [Planctomycetes bacterium]|nr:hypothetical protein [Planctomycetota bacterium]